MGLNWLGGMMPFVSQSFLAVLSSGTGDRVARVAALQVAIQVGRAEIAIAHVRGRHERREDVVGRILHLLRVVFVREEEEQLVVVFVEMRVREEHRAADVAAGIIEVRIRLRGILQAGQGVRAELVVEGVAGIEGRVTGIKVSLTVELSCRRICRWRK